jgi:squalene-associated FAD-dependent desaturase
MGVRPAAAPAEGVKPRLAVVGAGWSGLACAVRLAGGGCEVTLIEAAPQAGGRARRVEIDVGARRLVLDNGQHLLIGAYHDTLSLMRTVGLDPDSVLMRLPLRLQYPDGFTLAACRGPAPWHLALGVLFARGLRPSARWAMLRWIDTCKRRQWQVDPDTSAADLLRGQPDEVVDRVWSPLCIAALNVRLPQASARIFLTVLRDSLATTREASDLLVPKADLSAVLPDAALRWLGTRGAVVRLRSPVRSMAPTPDGRRWQIACASTPPATVLVDAVVLALPPPRAAALLATCRIPALSAAIDDLQWIDMAPISTVYLDHGAGVRLARPVLALQEAPDRAHFGQWAFDRGRLDPALDGIISVVVSANGPHESLEQADLAAAVAAQISAVLRLPPARASRVVQEKRATIVPRPGLLRPPTRLPTRGLYLAGDAADSHYPSTIEGSVRSGNAAADAVLAEAVRHP